VHADTGTLIRTRATGLASSYRAGTAMALPPSSGALITGYG
jgi:hypothetical protein